MKKLFFTLAIISTFVLTSLAQSSRKEEKNRQRDEQYKLAINLIDAGKYQFNGRRAITQKGRSIDLTTRQNFLVVNDDKAVADMPYFGRAFSAGYSSTDGGVKFDGPMEEVNIQKNDKKRRIIVKFKVRSPDDTYSCSLTVTGPEAATLSVASNKRQTITYNGIIGPLGEK
jgi:type II secretory pathway pseudopilin PulG